MRRSFWVRSLGKEWARYEGASCATRSRGTVMTLRLGTSAQERLSPIILSLARARNLVQQQKFRTHFSRILLLDYLQHRWRILPSRLSP